MTTPASDLPFVTIATFCEHVLTEADNVQSVIRIIDRVTHRIPPGTAAIPMSFVYPLWYLLTLRSGNARGPHTIKLMLERPDGKFRELITQEAEFEGDDKGVAVGLQMSIQFEIVGVYWMRVYYDDQMITSSALRIEIQVTPELDQVTSG